MLTFYVTYYLVHDIPFPTLTPLLEKTVKRTSPNSLVMFNKCDIFLDFSTMTHIQDKCSWTEGVCSVHSLCGPSTALVSGLEKAAGGKQITETVPSDVPPIARRLLYVSVHDSTMERGSFHTALWLA